MRVDGKHVIVTGASSGIGRALSFSLAKRGAALVLAARRAERLKELAGEIVGRFPGAPAPVVVPCDVTSREDVSRLVGGTVERLGDIDVLINNAGAGVYGEAESTDIDDFHQMMSVNYFGPVNLMLEVLPFMRRREDGLIVNVTSVAALYGVPYLAAYCASKSALVAASQSLRAELDGTGIRIMLVYPGYTESEFFESEKRVGTAERPSGAYAPAERVAEAIVRGIEAGGRDLILTAQGKVLNAIRGIAPGVVEKVTRRTARELKGGTDSE